MNAKFQDTRNPEKNYKCLDRQVTYKEIGLKMVLDFTKMNLEAKKTIEQCLLGKITA